MDRLPDEFHNKDELLEKIISERKLLDFSLDRIGRDLSIHFSEKPILHDGWSIKDTIAHITEWELTMIRCLNTSLNDEIPNQPLIGLLEEEVDQINANYYQQNKHKPIGQVTDEYQDSYQLILETMQTVSENDLFDPQRFDWLDGKPFWPIVAANTCWHYGEHRAIIEKAIIEATR